LIVRGKQSRLQQFMRGVGKIILISLLVISVAGLGSGIGFSLALLKQVPRVEALQEYTPPLITKIYDANGELLARLGMEYRIMVPLEKLPHELQDAVIAIEDTRFYRHGGIDFVRIGGAIMANMRKRKLAQGGSTITQQLARSLFLTRERSVIRKLKEASLALMIEQKFSKEEILELYLNQIYFGHNAYGVQAAATIYFNKSVEKLDLSECALLAGLIRAPNKYSPFNSHEEAIQRRAVVLERMVELGFITQLQADTARKAPLRLSKLYPTETRAPYFVEYVRRYLEAKYGPDLVYKGGLNVYTTLELQIQKAAEKTLEEGLISVNQRLNPKSSNPEGEVEEEPGVEGALIALEPQTGYIKAMIGGRDFRLSEFNRAYQAQRQPGSAFKPLIYATAFDNGFTPADIILDAPVVFEEGNKKWKPVNYDRKFYGPTSLRVGLEHSRNVVTVKLLDKVGPTTVVNYARRFGIQGNLSRDLSLALGTSVVSLRDLTSAYGIFANRGIRTTPLAVIKITDSKGKILEENFPQEEEVLREEVNYVILNVLKGVIENGTGRGARILGRPAGGKTGTTDQNTDVWFIGFVPSLVAGVWIGFDDNRPLGSEFTAANTAVPIWTQFMENALAGTPPIDWPLADRITFARIDPESGLLATPQCPQSFLETFIKGTEPTTYCNLHQEESILPPDYF